MNKLTNRIVVFTALAATPLAGGCPPDDAGLLGPDTAPVRIVASSAIGSDDPFEVTAHRLSGDVLQVDLSYSGGCQTHEFEGLIGTSVLESAPPQMVGRITHDDRDDPCDSIVSGTIALDLTPLRDFYRSLYGAGVATVELQLAPIAEPILYAF
jgi:hypothetical protein